MSNLQSVSIIAAFPIGAVIVLIAASFLKDASAFLKENKKGYINIFVMSFDPRSFCLGSNFIVGLYIDLPLQIMIYL